VKASEIKDGVRARDRLEIDEQTPILLSKIIVSSWDDNPKSRPEFGKIAKQLESDIILLQVALPTVFVAAQVSGNHPKAPQDGMSGNSNLGEVNFFESEPQAITKVHTLGSIPISTDPAAVTNPVNRPLQQKKPANFLSIYTKKKNLAVLAVCLIVLIILAVVVALLVIFINPQQKTASESPSTELTTTTSIISFDAHTTMKKPDALSNASTNTESGNNFITSTITESKTTTSSDSPLLLSSLISLSSARETNAFSISTTTTVSSTTNTQFLLSILQPQ
jgi:hypothetical protein